MLIAAIYTKFSEPSSISKTWFLFLANSYPELTLYLLIFERILFLYSEQSLKFRILILIEGFQFLQLKRLSKSFIITGNKNVIKLVHNILKFRKQPLICKFHKTAKIFIF